MKSIVLQAKGLKKYYSAGENVTKALDGIDLEIYYGEFAAIVGTSGSGKSTLLHMLGGLDSPTEGSVRVGDKELSRMNDEELAVFRRRSIGFVFQQYNLVQTLNVRENIVLPILLDGGKIDEDYFQEIVGLLKIEEKLENLPNQLSGGQQQRAAIARALASKPSILLADEPTGNLDSRTSQDVMVFLKASNQRFQQTMVMITHNLDIAQMADRIIRIEDGRIQIGGCQQMFQVRNKEALRLLAGRQMKKCRQRNGIAIGAIILTTILFSALFTLGGGVLEQAQQSLMRKQGGVNQASIKFLSMPEYERVKEAGGYKKIGYSIVTGTGADERLQKINTEVRYGEDYVAQSFRSYPTQGRMPQEKMEIAVSGIVLEAMGLSDELGREIVFPIEVNGCIYEDAFTLCGVWEGDPLAPAQEIWVSKAYSEETAPILMTSFTEDTPYEGCVMAEIDFSNTWNLEGKLDDLLERSGLPGDTRGGLNPVYTNFQMDPGVLLAGVVFLTAILVSGYLIIYNVFYISVTQDIQFYGLLKTIGASGKQLKKIVFRQAMRLSCIGIPLGLLAGYAVGKALLPAVTGEIDGIRGFGDYHVSPLVLFGAAVFSLLTVYVSFRSPGRVAASVSPIEAVHYNGGNLSRRKHRKLCVKKRGFMQKDAPLTLGVRNLRRDGKKAVLVIVSLSLSLTLLNTTFTILRGFDLERYVESQTNGDFEVTDWTIAAVGTNSKNLEGIDAEFEEAVRHLPGLKRFEKVYAEASLVELPADALKWIEEEIAKGDASRFFGNYGEEEWVQVYAATGGLVEHAEYQEGTFDAEKWAQGNYVVCEDSAARFGYPGRFYEPGDSIILKGKNGQKKEYTVMAIGRLPFSITTRQDINFGINVILPVQEFVELYGEKQPLSVVYDVEKSHREEAERITAQLAEESDKVYVSFETLKAEFQQSKQTYSLIGGILSLILGAIGILNFVNIVVTGILTRQKELAMLSAVGMGGRQMKKMLLWESAAYIGSAVLLTATVGNLFSWLLCQSEIVENQWAFVYHFTFLPVAACLPVLLAVAMVVPLMFYRKIGKSSVVERLRYTE